MKIKKKLPESDYDLGLDVNLDETTCTPETLEYLNRPDEEREMPLEEWQALYAKRVKDGYYERKKLERAEEEKNWILPF